MRSRPCSVAPPGGEGDAGAEARAEDGWCGLCPVRKLLSRELRTEPAVPPAAGAVV